MVVEEKWAKNNSYHHPRTSYTYDEVGWSARAQDLKRYVKRIKRYNPYNHCMESLRGNDRAQRGEEKIALWPAPNQAPTEAPHSTSIGDGAHAQYGLCLSQKMILTRW